MWDNNDDEAGRCSTFSSGGTVYTSRASWRRYYGLLAHGRSALQTELEECAISAE